ncbi:MAG: hypothetical protein JWR04_387 [Rhodoglobus sp.]|jgi:hypothetical protein|nr:hypothetical protein [Rhodoglobus sp.]
MTTDMSDDEVMAQVAQKLSEKNADIPRDVIDGVVREEYFAIAGRPVRDYLSVLTERAAKRRLKKLAKAS